MKSAPAITLDLVPSRRLAAAAFAIAVLAIAALLLSGLPLAAGSAAGMAVSIAAWVSLRRFLAPRWVRLARDPGGWQLVDRHHQAAAAQLRHHVRFGPLVALAFAVPGHADFRCIVDRAAVDADGWRQLVLALAREPRAGRDPDRARSL